MGRLTLNVLLSFAQFEREVTGERIRDKIAASKAKGMWMGGVVPRPAPKIELCISSRTMPNSSGAIQAPPPMTNEKPARSMIFVRPLRRIYPIITPSTRSGNQ